jgi:hypothetical protein
MILDEVKRKKEFRGLSDAFVSRVLVLHSKKYDVTKEKERKKLVKEARATLRHLYSSFRLPGYHRKERYLEKMQDWGDKELAEKILRLHLSSKERVLYLDKLYAHIRKHVQFKTVLDLGCGLNVFSFPWMGYVHYYGVDVNKDDVEFCNSYLERFNLGGAVRWGDVQGFDKFVHTEVTFMFKMLEALETLERGSTEKLLRKVTSPYIVASFATTSLSGGKKLSTRRLKWFKELVTIEDEFRLGNEVYYVIKR